MDESSERNRDSAMEALMTDKSHLRENDTAEMSLYVCYQGTCMWCFDNINVTSETSRPPILVLQHCSFCDVRPSHLYCFASCTACQESDIETDIESNCQLISNQLVID